MQRTKSKILSILLSLVMLLSLLPTTALATTYNDVKVNGVSLGDGKYLASNTAATASSSSMEPTTYVAWYKDGVLTLNNFTGKSDSGIVLQGAPAADLTIKLIGNNTITPYDVGIQGNNGAGSITITGGGTLTINATNSTGSVFGINGYANSVTISGSADVTINATATATNKESYGIKSSKAVSILDSASVSITCKTPNSTSRSDSCNGIFSEKNVTIDTDGTIQIDVHDAGKEAGSYGINSMGTLTLTKVGEMTVKWKKSGVNGAPLIPSDAQFDPTAYDTLVDTTNCIATYRPKGTTPTPITGELAVAITKPVKGETPQSAIAAATQYTGTIAWEGNPTTFAANTAYIAKVELTANTGYQFASDVNPTVTDATISDKSVSADGKTLTFKATFPKTDTKTLKGIDIITNPELKLAVPTAAPNGTATNERSLAVTGIYDDDSVGPATVTWEITTTPIPKGVSLDGSTLKVTNKAETGTFTIKATSTEGGHTDIETVTITKDVSKETAIVATAPATGTSITVPTGSTKTSGNCSYKVYDQYGAEMTGSHATWKMKLDPATVTGVNLIAANGSISVTSDATACKATLYAESGALKSNEITFNITRETSQVTSVHVYAPEYIMNVPKVTEPGATNKAYQQFDPAKVLDQYGQEMTGKTVTWNVADDTGNSVTGVSIDNNGKLTVTNEAPAITVYVTATCSGIESNKSKVTIKKETAKASLVEICNQVGEAPKTRLLIPAATFTNSEAYTAKVYDQYGVYMPGEMVDWELVPATVAGVELDTTTSTGNAILKVNSTAISGTTFKLKATTATLGTSGVKEQDITVQKKTNVSDKINFNDGSLTYNGNGQKYEKASISGITAGDNPKWTYTYAIKSGGTGMLDTATGLPKIVGTYTVTATYEDSSNIGSKSATLKITPREVAIPAPDTTVYTYDGTAKTYQIPASADYTVNHATQTNANETGYTVTVALTDENNTIWSDGNTIVKHYTFKIMRATPTGDPAYTEITTSGKTLVDANLTKGTITPDGTIKWNDAEDTVVEANKSYGWTYTPADTTNYKPLTGSIKLWRKSTSSGGYYYAPTAAVVPDMPMLYRGCTGDAVKTLQDKLNALGYNSGNVDGIFGAKTYAAVTAFQKANSLGVDGIGERFTDD